MAFTLPSHPPSNNTNGAMLHNNEITSKMSKRLCQVRQHMLSTGPRSVGSIVPAERLRREDSALIFCPDPNSCNLTTADLLHHRCTSTSTPNCHHQSHRARSAAALHRTDVATSSATSTSSQRIRFWRIGWLSTLSSPVLSPCKCPL